MNFAKCAALIIVAAFLGCAGPRYQTVYRLEPPGDPAALACLADCERELGACTEDCRDRYAVCAEAVEAEGEARYQDALKRYEGARDQYRRDLDRYHLSLSIGWGRGGGWYGAGWHDPWWPYGFYGPRYYPPQPPQPPSRAAVLASVRAQRCNSDCGCQPSYETCFIGCGGSKVPERRCIANCPPGEQ